MEDKAFCAYFVDKVFAFYELKTSPFVYLSHQVESNLY